ncbi:hypothetical protein STEG23_015054 [Scotinomys teguina]
MDHVLPRASPILESVLDENEFSTNWKDATDPAVLAAEDATDPAALAAEAATDPAALVAEDATDPAVLAAEDASDPAALAAEDATDPAALVAEAPKKSLLIINTTSGNVNIMEFNSFHIGQNILYNETLLNSGINFLLIVPPNLILPCHWTKLLYYQPMRAAHIHSVQKDILQHHYLLWPPGHECRCQLRSEKLISTVCGNYHRDS